MDNSSSTIPVSYPVSSDERDCLPPQCNEQQSQNDFIPQQAFRNEQQSQNNFVPQQAFYNEQQSRNNFVPQQASYYPSSADGPIQNNAPCLISPLQIWEKIGSSPSFTVRQLKKTRSYVCRPCSSREENAYLIFAGFNADTQTEILRVDEVPVISMETFYIYISLYILT